MKLSDGAKTSEFVVALITVIIPILNSTFGWGLPLESILGLLTYIGGRSIVKAAKEFKSDAKTKSTG